MLKRVGSKCLDDSLIARIVQYNLEDTIRAAGF
jgi:hypothetical protein